MFRMASDIGKDTPIVKRNLLSIYRIYPPDISFIFTAVFFKAKVLVILINPEIN